MISDLVVAEVSAPDPEPAPPTTVVGTVFRARDTRLYPTPMGLTERPPGYPPERRHRGRCDSWSPDPFSKDYRSVRTMDNFKTRRFEGNKEELVLDREWALNREYWVSQSYL